MAAITGATTTSTVAWINSEKFTEAVIPPNEDAQIHQSIAWYYDASNAGSNVVKFRKETAVSTTLTFASPKSEADDGGYGNAVAFTGTSASATGAVIGLKRVVSRRVQTLLPEDLITRVVANTRRAVAKRMTTDTLLRIQDVTSNTTSFSGLSFNRDRWGVASAAFEAQNPEGQFAAILGPGHWRDLKSDIRNTTASIEAAGASLGLLGANQPGLKGMFEGVPVMVTGLVPAEDGSNDNGCFAKIGEGGAFGLASWWGLTPERMPGNPNMAGGYLVEFDEDKDDDVTFVWVKAYIGHVLTYEENIREFIAAA